MVRLARLGSAGSGRARQGWVRQAGFGLGPAWLAETARRGEAWLGEVWQPGLGTSGRGPARLGMVRLARQGEADTAWMG